jgi:hypothetical protein
MAGTALRVLGEQGSETEAASHDMRSLLSKITIEMCCAEISPAVRQAYRLDIYIETDLHTHLLSSLSSVQRSRAVRSRLLCVTVSKEHLP